MHCSEMTEILARRFMGGDYIESMCTRWRRVVAFPTVAGWYQVWDEIQEEATARYWDGAWYWRDDALNLSTRSGQQDWLWRGLKVKPE